jgi:hypothetical protein
VPRPRHAWESRLGVVPPTPWARPSPPLHGTVRRGRCQLRGTVPPTFVRLTRRALEVGRRNPRRGTNAFSMSTQDYTTTSGRQERSSPSLSALCGHPRHCNATPGTAATSPTLLRRTGTGHRHARHCASYGLPSTAPSSQHAGSGRMSNLHATTLEAAPVQAQDSPRRPNRSKIHWDGRQLRGTACHAFTRRRIVRLACKLLSPWPIKGEAVPQPQGDDGRRTLARFPPAHRYWHLPESVPLGPGGTTSSPTSPVAPLCRHYDATQYKCPEHTPAGRTAPARTRIYLVSPSCLALAIER